MPSVDWKILKAQCFQESLFDEDAISPVGAQGICQFMPGTWREQAQKLGVMASPFNAKINIQVAASYMGQLRAGWTAPRPEWDRHSLAMASYNAGFGNILKAQSACGNPNFYSLIIVCLPCITGQHSEETMTYVQRIWNFYERIREDDQWL